MKLTWKQTTEQHVQSIVCKAEDNRLESMYERLEKRLDWLWTMQYTAKYPSLYPFRTEKEQNYLDNNRIDWDKLIVQALAFHRLVMQEMDKRHIYKYKPHKHGHMNRQGSWCA